MGVKKSYLLNRQGPELKWKGSETEHGWDSKWVVFQHDWSKPAQFLRPNPIQPSCLNTYSAETKAYRRFHLFSYQGSKLSSVNCVQMISWRKLVCLEMCNSAKPQPVLTWSSNYHKPIPVLIFLTDSSPNPIIVLHCIDLPCFNSSRKPDHTQINSGLSTKEAEKN